jgi:serine/threonine-protein kinase HipA
VGAHGRAATLENALTHKEAFNLSEHDACEIISRIVRCVRQWRMYFEQYGLAAKDMDAIATAFRRIEDVASPELRKRLP